MQKIRITQNIAKQNHIKQEVAKKEFDFLLFAIWCCFGHTIDLVCCFEFCWISVPALKDKSGVVMIVDYSSDYTFVNGV